MSENQPDIADNLEAHLRDKGLPVPQSVDTFSSSPPDILEETEEGTIPRISLPGEGILISSFARKLGELLRTHNAPIYNREDSAITISPTTSKAEIISEVAFRTLIENYCIPVDFKSSTPGGSLIPTSISNDVASVVLHSQDFLSQINKVSAAHNQRLPIMRKNGKIELLPIGYDFDSQVYTAKSAINYRTDLSLEEASTLWRDYFAEFPFADWTTQALTNKLPTSRSFAVHTATALSQYCQALFSKGLLRLTFVYNSNSQRSGKSLLAKIAIGVTHGRAPITPFERDDSKLKNTLDVIIRNREAFALFDNLRGRIASTHLESLISSPSVNIRPFHTQNLIEYTNDTGIIITGNNLSWNTDLGNRILVCDLQMDEANPQGRKFKRIYDDTTHLEHSNRSDLLACMWAFLNHWDTAARPKPKKTRAGFERFSALIGGIVNFTGIGDPLETRPDDIYGGGDTDYSDMLDLITQLCDRLTTGAPGGKFRFHELTQICVERNSFPSAIEGRWIEEELEDPEDEFNTIKIRIYKLTPSSAKKFSSIISGQYGGRTFLLENGKKVKWDSRGKKRGKWYEVRYES